MRGEGTSFIIHPDCAMVNSANSMANGSSKLVDGDKTLEQSHITEVDGIGGGADNGLVQTDGGEEETQEGLTQSSEHMSIFMSPICGLTAKALKLMQTHMPM